MADKRQQLRYKGDRCVACGKTVEDVLARYGTFHRVFQFHHSVPEDKHPEYDNLIRRKLSTEQLDELDKCVLLCSFCHDLVEAQGNRVTLRMSLTLAGRTVEQAVRGHFLHDRVKQRVKFLTNERFKLVPYIVRLGGEPPRVEFETELEDGRLVGYLGQLRTLRTVAVFGRASDVPLMHAEYIGDDMMRVLHDLAFPLLSAELRGPTNVWTRPGKAVVDTGVVLDEAVVEMEMPVPALTAPSGTTPTA